MDLGLSCGASVGECPLARRYSNGEINHTPFSEPLEEMLPPLGVGWGAAAGPPASARLPGAAAAPAVLLISPDLCSRFNPQTTFVAFGWLAGFLISYLPPTKSFKVFFKGMNF